MSALSAPVPQPQGLTFRAWGALVAEQLAQYGVAAPSSETDWKPWVCALFYVPALAAANIPEPGSFADWQSWAVRFLDSVR